MSHWSGNVSHNFCNEQFLFYVTEIHSKYFGGFRTIATSFSTIIILFQFVERHDYDLITTDLATDMRGIG